MICLFLSFLVSFGCCNKYHRLGSLNNRHLCFTALEVEADWVPNESTFLHYLHLAERRIVFLISSGSLTPSWGLCDLMTSKGLTSKYYNTGD